jgi:peptidoglycan/xylan/chitin deacetylase (PgdA/CDA1 family)
MVMKEATFVNLLEYVKKSFRVIGLQELLESSQNGKRPRCLITFDDGWEDNYTRAYPWMGKYAVPATIFVATGFIGGEDTFWAERVVKAWKDPVRRQEIQSRVACMSKAGNTKPELDGVIEHLKRMAARQRDELLRLLVSCDLDTKSAYSTDRLLTWDEVAEMNDAGVEFGAHTVTHSLLPYEEEATIEREVCEAKQVLEEKLKKKVRAFAYPNGDWDSRSRLRVAAAGYDCAFTTQPGWYHPGQDPYTIRRILLHEGNVTGWNGEFSPAMFTLTLARSA